MTSELLYIIVIYSGVALLTDIYPEHDPHVSKHSFMTHMICIRMLSQILDSADTTRFLDLFRIPVSRAEFDDSNKHSFFLTFSPRIHTFFSINSSHFPLDPPESAQPGLRC